MIRKTWIISMTLVIIMVGTALSGNRQPDDKTVAVDESSPNEILEAEWEALLKGEPIPPSPYFLFAQRTEPESSLADKERFRRLMQKRHTEGARKRQKLEGFRLLKLLEFLDLSEEQETEFVVMFRNVRRELREVDEHRRDVLERLGAGIHDGNITDEEINRLVDDLISIRSEKHRITKTYFEEAREHLTPEQSAKLIIFQERFEYDLLEQVQQFRRLRGGGGPPEEFGRGQGRFGGQGR